MPQDGTLEPAGIFYEKSSSIQGLISQSLCLRDVITINELQLITNDGYFRGWHRVALCVA